MVKDKRPSILFLMETKLRSDKISFLRGKLDFDSVFVVDCVGRSGGLALFWRDEVTLEIQKYSNRHINAVVKELCGDFLWKLTGFYGNPETAKREEGWNLQRRLQQLAPIPCVCIGDFNEIIE